MQSAGFEFRILGPLEVIGNGVHLPITAAKLRILLASLLIDANKVVSFDALIDRLWAEDPPGGARNTLQNYVLRLRRLLGEAGTPVPLVTRPHGYLIEAPDGSLDLERFDRLLNRARAVAGEDPRQASALLAEALRLWRGEPLADVPSDLLRRDVVPALAERRLDAVQLRIETELALGRHEHVLGELRELTTAHPLRERFWAQRMLALHRSGRRSESLHCYRAARDLLVHELGVEPGAELRELHQRLLTADAPPRDAGPLPVRGNLPEEMTSFVGRERELAEIGRLLAAGRLVTLTGVGGVGKTRLARRSGAALSAGFPDGVWLVDLAPLSEPRLLGRTVAQALGVRDQSARSGEEVLRDHLRGRRLLMILDNCEHVVPAAAELLDALLRACPGLRVLATSRHRLGLQGEHCLLVPPLPLPPPASAAHHAAGERLTDYDAVALLADRAAAVAPGFRVTAENEALVAQLCRRLDGIPLAIELAAVRLSTLSAAEILDRLDDRLCLLADNAAPATPRYHRTLQDVIRWSHDLCTGPERLLWAKLSVFSGGFDLEAAEQVCASDGIARDDVLDLLTSLAHKSVLTVVSGGGRTRYRLLETIRQYGRERLAELGLYEAVRLRHRDHYRRLAAEAAADWCSVRESDWLSRMRRELPNMRAALEFCVTVPGQADVAQEMAVNLMRTRCWFFSSTIAEGRHWLERARALPAAATTGPLRTVTLATLTWVTLVQGDRAHAEEYLAECRASADRAPEPAVTTYLDGAYALLVHADAAAIPTLARARVLFRRAGAHGDAHMATMFWAIACAFLGDRETAVSAGADYLAETEASGAPWARSWALWAIGLIELRHGDTAKAIDLLRDALLRQRELDDRWGPPWGTEVLAWAVAAAGRHEQAAVLLGVAHRLRHAVGADVFGLRPFRDAHAHAVTLVREALGPDAYDAAFGRGAEADCVTHLV